MSKALCCHTFCLLLVLSNQALAVTNLLVNPGFQDADGDPNTLDPNTLGDGWGTFGNTGFNAFFGDNPHASLFGDNPTNSGGVFQQGILGTAGTTYQFDLLDARVESNWDADLSIGVEFYEADDTTKIGETKVTLDTATRISNGTIDGNVFSVQATAPVGTVFARPIFEFDNVFFGVNPSSSNTFVFDTYMSEVPAPGGELLKNPGFDNGGSIWSSFGAAGFNDFFGGNEHASLFSDSPGNFGGVYQQSILGSEGDMFEFALLDVRIEENFEASLRFGLEYFAADDSTKIGETISIIDPNTGQIDGNAFVMQGTVPAGTTYVRPIVLFDSVTSTASGQENVFIFDASLIELSSIVEDADFNEDGSVDGLDFLIWQRGTGSPGGLSMGDANGDGNVNDADLAIWETQYGTSSLQGTSAAVPEPTAFSLLTIAGLALAIRQRRA